jgi:23S rRNA pseudouridine1911/1915/1917 synthase
MNSKINSQTGICFFKVPGPIMLADFLMRADYAPLAVPNDDIVRDWLDYGCVYLNGQRLRHDVELAQDQVLRVHTRRKSYWQERQSLKPLIVEETDDFLVLNKPGGLPTHPTLDNFRDNAKFLLEQELGRPVYITHRLDIPTQGLLLIAKTPEAQRQLNREFSKGRVEKIYRSLNENLVAPGLLTHAMDPESRVPKVVVRGEFAGWWTLKTEVLRAGAHGKNFWHEMRLLTGKTHQIRAQMADCKAPILGDFTYGAEKDTTSLERIALECFRLAFTLRSRTFAISRPQSIIPALCP